nr:reverse transcriptase domain-containing protein [Tanacetum cinerariifolium]
MADNRTMAQMLQAPIEGYEDAIIVPPINANNFELKQTLINLVQSNQFTSRQDPHNHLRFFNKVTSTFRHPEVPNTTIKLLLFLFSLEGEARIWLDKEPPQSILTWEDLVSKFINQFFPPSKTTYLRNEIINFLQKPNETFNEAWERFKDLLRKCPHHSFSELHQLDTFYNALNPNDQDALDSATRGQYSAIPDRRCWKFRSRKSTAHAIINVHKREIILRQDKQSLTLQCGDTPSIKKYKFKSLNKIDFIDAGDSDLYSKEIENHLNGDSIPIGVENFVFNMEEDILFLERLLSEDPSPLNPNQTNSFIKEPEHSFSMGYEHFNTTLVTEFNEVAESCIKNLVPILRECEVTSNESESNEPIKDDYSVFTPFPNPLFKDKDDVVIHDDVLIEESKVHSNLLFDNDEINSDELELHVESNFVKPLSTHDALIDSSQKFDNLEEFSRPLIPIHNAEEERIKREHAEYISRMEMLFTINPRPHLTVNANIIFESIPSSLIPIQDNDSQREEIDIVTNADDVLPLGFENDDSDGEIDVVEELHINNSISNSEHEFFDSEASDFDNTSVPLPPPEPPDEELDFEINFGDEISVVRNTIIEFECLNPRVEFDISNDENDDYYSFMFVTYPEMFSFLLSAESEDTIFDPGISVESQRIYPSLIEVSCVRIFVPVHKIFTSFD